MGDSRKETMPKYLCLHLNKTTWRCIQPGKAKDIREYRVLHKGENPPKELTDQGGRLPRHARFSCRGNNIIFVAENRPAGVFTQPFNHLFRIQGYWPSKYHLYDIPPTNPPSHKMLLRRGRFFRMYNHKKVCLNKADILPVLTPDSCSTLLGSLNLTTQAGFLTYRSSLDSPSHTLRTYNGILSLAP